MPLLGEKFCARARSMYEFNSMNQHENTEMLFGFASSSRCAFILYTFFIHLFKARRVIEILLMNQIINSIFTEKLMFFLKA